MRRERIFSSIAGVVSIAGAGLLASLATTGCSRTTSNEVGKSSAASVVAASLPDCELDPKACTGCNSNGDFCCDAGCAQGDQCAYAWPGTPAGYCKGPCFCNAEGNIECAYDPSGTACQPGDTCGISPVLGTDACVTLCDCNASGTFDCRVICT